MIDIYQIHIDEKLIIEMNMLLLSYVSEGKRANVARYHHPIDAHRTLLGEVMVRIAICNKLQVTNDQLVFGINDHKKPLLIKPQGYYFNISHSGHWVVCALGSQRVGIDVEQVKSIDLAIAENYFAKSEYEALLKVEGEERLRYFFKLWTLKESYIKAVGKGLSIPLDSFSVMIREDHDIRLADGHPHAYFQQYWLDHHHVMALCTEHETKPSMNTFNYEQLRVHLPLLETQQVKEVDHAVKWENHGSYRRSQ